MKSSYHRQVIEIFGDNFINDTYQLFIPVLYKVMAQMFAINNPIKIVNIFC